MAESLTLTVPKSVTTYKVNEIQINRKSQFINVEVEDSIGNIIRASYGGAQAMALIVALNKANLSTSSLEKRILLQLVTDGHLPTGNVTGVPD